MTTRPRQKGATPSLEQTTHNRVLKETSERANELAQRWNTTKLEVYRWLVESAYNGEIGIDQGELYRDKIQSNG